MMTGMSYSNYSLSYLHEVETTMVWYVVFHGRKPGVHASWGKPGVHASWGVYSEYAVCFSSATYQSHSTRMQAEEAYVAFLEYQHKDRKAEHVAQNLEHVETSGVGMIG
jgi:hypothetical protein